MTHSAKATAISRSKVKSARVLMDRAIRDYQHAEHDLQRRASTALYTTQQRWDLVIQARHIIDEIELSL